MICPDYRPLPVHQRTVRGQACKVKASGIPGDPARLRRLRAPLLALALAVVLISVACGGEDQLVFKVGGIPDQDSSRLARRYGVFSDYLSEKLGVEVRYVSSVDYAAVVTAFGQGELQLAFFGGLTGVQARLRDPGAEVIAQREQDAQFHSKFIVRAGLPVYSLENLEDQAANLTFTFGSESSTSGHLMPRHFLSQAGVDADRDFRAMANYSGSHDLTWKLVENGSFDAGVLNEDVWDRAVADGRVDTGKVRVFHTTPQFFDYNWTVPGGLDKVYGDGFTGRLQASLLELNLQEHGQILALFSTERFIESSNDSYRDIEQVARRQGIIR